MDLAILLGCACSYFRSLGPGFPAVGTEQGADPVSRGQVSALCLSMSSGLVEIWAWYCMLLGEAWEDLKGTAVGL